MKGKFAGAVLSASACVLPFAKVNRGEIHDAGGESGNDHGQVARANLLKLNGELLPMCMKSTRDAVRAICATGPSVTTQQMKDALAALDGETSAHSLTNAAPMDRALTRHQVAQLLGVSPKTVTSYAHQGLIRGVTCGDKRGHIRRYSESSIRSLMEGGEE